MRARSAYISSVGTTTILIAAALFMLGVVSALVAFRGWPDSASSDDVTSVPLEPPQRASAGLERRPAVREVTVRPVGARRVGAAARTAVRRSTSTVGLIKVSPPAMRPTEGVGLLVNSPVTAPAPSAPAPAAPRAPEPPAAPETPELALPEPEPELPLPETSPDVEGLVTGIVAPAPDAISPEPTVDTVMGISGEILTPR